MRRKVNHSALLKSIHYWWKVERLSPLLSILSPLLKNHLLAIYNVDALTRP